MTVKELKKVLQNVNEDLTVYGECVDFFGEIILVEIANYQDKVICNFQFEEPEH